MATLWGLQIGPPLVPSQFAVITGTLGMMLQMKSVDVRMIKTKVHLRSDLHFVHKVRNFVEPCVPRVEVDAFGGLRWQ
jgi:hypothetical protein